MRADMNKCLRAIERPSVLDTVPTRPLLDCESTEKAIEVEELAASPVEPTLQEDVEASEPLEVSRNDVVTDDQPVTADFSVISEKRSSSRQEQ